MNLRLAPMLLVLGFAFARNATGQVPGNHLAFGSQSIVADHAAQMTDQFWLDIYQQHTNGSVVFFAEPRDVKSFSDMTALDSWLYQRTSQNATNILSSTNAVLDNQFIAYASAVDWKDGFYIVAYCYHPFYLVKSGTNYSLPDFSSMAMKLESDMIYRVTNIDWAVMQVYDSSSNIINALGPSGGIVDKPNQLLDLPTAYLTGTNLFRLIVVSGTNCQYYQVFGAGGNLIPELPNTISLPVIAKGTDSLQVTAGDVGRVLVLQGATNLISWVDLTGPHTNYFSGYDPGFSYSEKMVFPSRFFRLKITTEKP